MGSRVGVPMKLSRAGRLAALFVLIIIELSCGDVYRPVAVPLPPTAPSPGASHYMLVLTGNGPLNPGAGLRLDVSGDTAVAQATTGEGPVSVVVLPNGTRSYIANSMSDTVSSFASSNPSTVTTTALSPTGLHPQPVFVHTTENAAVYVANYADSTVDAINVATNVVTNTIAVGTNPVALLETADSNHLYSVNLASNTVTSIDPVSKTVKTTIPVGTSPTWILQRSDNQRVYVLNSGSGTVTSIDTLSDTVTCGASGLPACPSVGAGANYMFYDSLRNRLYVTNPVSKSLVTLNVGVDPPAVIGTPTSFTLSPTSVTALNDGSRVYVVSFQKGAPCTTIPGDTRPCIQSQVTVLNAMDMSLRSTIPLQSTVNITSAAQDPASQSTTFTYTVTSGSILQTGVTVVISGMSDAGNNGTFVISQASGNTFTVANAAGVSNSSQSGTGLSVVEVDTANATGCDLPGLGLPGGVLGGVRFRMFIAAGADARRVYASSCDAGTTTVIRTVSENSSGTVFSPDSVVLTIFSAPSAFPSTQPGLQPPPQNPFFIFASP
jgi:YVTN family beta-propeller protein